MAKMIGLSRNLKISWLNQVVELISDGLNEQEIKEKLNKYLSFEITSPTNIRKTREILMYIWYYDNKHSEKLRPQAKLLIEKYPEYSVAIHWCMMLAAYPIFVDMCKLIGKMSEFQDEITLLQIKKKLFDEWGERTTLYHSVDKLISTLKAFKVLKCDKPGKYQINKQIILKQDVSVFFIHTLMNIDNGGYYSLMEINSSSYFFPFDYCIKKEDVYQDKSFITSNLGGDLSIALNRK